MTELFSTVLRMSGYGLVAALIASLAVLLLSRARCSKTGRRSHRQTAGWTRAAGFTLCSP